MEKRCLIKVSKRFDAFQIIVNNCVLILQIKSITPTRWKISHPQKSSVRIPNYCECMSCFLSIIQVTIVFGFWWRHSKRRECFPRSRHFTKLKKNILEDFRITSGYPHGFAVVWCGKNRWLARGSTHIVDLSPTIQPVRVRCSLPRT